MDRYDMEPGYGLHQDQRRLRQLLCSTVLGTVSRCAWASVRNGLRSDAQTGAANPAAYLEAAPDDFCQLNERSFPEGDSEGIYRGSFRHHGAGRLACIKC